jgi:hypothetical protein
MTNRFLISLKTILVYFKGLFLEILNFLEQHKVMIGFIFAIIMGGIIAKKIQDNP